MSDDAGGLEARLMAIIEGLAQRVESLEDQVYKNKGRARMRAELIEREMPNPMCCYCRTIHPHGKGLTLEHLTPLSRGGTDDPSNLALSCRACNSLKGILTDEEFRPIMGERRLVMLLNREIHKSLEPVPATRPA